ncbi:ester cyclase [Streptomyces sp. NPDC005799]|uniref:nuclear transport factor 2 family protein n=1 Tax=Streptomyces sp. NPDC005799 TaxID=3154678 RepID=UPI0033DDB5E0
MLISAIGTKRAVRVLLAAATAGVLSVVGVAASAASPLSASAASAVGGDRQTAANKAMVVYFYDQLWNHDNLAVIDEFVRPDYIQHDPHSPNGPEPLRQLLTKLWAANPDMHTHIDRVAAEGDLVLLYSDGTAAPGAKTQAVVDIFRVQDGKIAEHWDVIQDAPDSTASGNDMFSTLSSPRLPGPDPRVSTAASKRVVSALVSEVTTGRDVTAFDRYVAGPYSQHDPQTPNGTTAAKEFFTSTFAAHPDFSVGVKRVIAEGDYVAVHSNYKFAADDRGFAVFDLFRVRHGKVVEHWDAVQPVPATSANDNTMF